MRVAHLLGGPLEPRNNRVLDLVEVLDSLCAVHEQVGARTLGTEAPDLPGLGEVVVILLSEIPCPGLRLTPGSDLTLRREALIGIYMINHRYTKVQS